MHVTNEEAATVDVAGQQQGGAFNHLLDVHVAAVFTGRHGAQALVFVAAVGAADFCRTGTDRLRWQSHATRSTQLAFAGQPFFNFFFARHDTHRTHEAIHGNANARQLSRDGLVAVQLPVGHIRIWKHIGQKAETRNQGGVTVFIGIDVNQFDGQHIAALGAFDVDGAGHRVNQVGVNRRDVFGNRVDIEFGVQGVTGVNHDQITGFRACNGLDGGMVTVETIGVIFTMLPFFRDFNDGLGLDVGGVSKSIGEKETNQQPPERGLGEILHVSPCVMGKEIYVCKTRDDHSEPLVGLNAPRITLVCVG